jgi:c-di-GMP-related signal transduction protein
MPETLLRFDLLLQQRSLNLSTITQTILSDLGATLQVMRATNEERSASKWPESRIEDCVIHLGRNGLRHCLKTPLSSLTVSQYISARRLWHRARVTAELSQRLLRESGTVSPEDAYLVGLFHEIGSLPARLGWTVNGIDLADIVVVRRTLAEEWLLPSALLRDTVECLDDN